MKYKTAELNGPLLDAAVAVAEAPIFHKVPPAYSSAWYWGGPIIEREKSTLDWYGGASSPVEWVANRKCSDEQRGPTPLIAAMRSYVFSKFGEEVELP